MAKIITQPAPEKISDAELYALVKSANVIFTVEDKFHIKNDQGIWPVVSERAAVLLIRSMFADPAWQPHLSAERIRRMIHSLKSDPELQKKDDEFIHNDLLRLSKGVWCVSRGKYISSDENLLFSRMVNADIPQDKPAESPAFHSFCKRVFSPDRLEQKKKALYEIIGYCISDLANVKKAIFLIGPANCGKSVMVDYIFNPSRNSEEDFSQVIDEFELDTFVNRFLHGQQRRKRQFKQFVVSLEVEWPIEKADENILKGKLRLVLHPAFSD